MAQWMLGYVSAVEYYQGVPLKGNAGAMLPWMDQYCKTNPTIHFASATRSLIVAFLLTAAR